MSTNAYMDEQLLKDQFKKLADGSPDERDIKLQDHIDWTVGPITKAEYEQLVAKFNYIEEKKSLGGFEFMKVIEGAIESFLQILVTLVIFNQLSLEGIFNHTIFAFSTGNKEDMGHLESTLSYSVLTERNAFILMAMISYIFVATGMVSFIDVLENGSLTIKEKLFLMVIHLIRVAISLFTTVELLLMKSEKHENLGYVIWLSIILIKFVLLAILTPIINKSSNFELKTAMLLVANLSSPVQIKGFIEFTSKGESKLERNFMMIWAVCALESLARLSSSNHFGSEQVRYQMLSPLNTQSYIFLIILLEYSIFVLWYLFFKKIYLWRNLIISNSDSSLQGIAKQVTKNDDVDETFELQPIEIEITKQENKDYVKKLDRSLSFMLMTNSDLPDQSSISRTSSYPSLKSTPYQAEIDIRSIKFLNDAKDYLQCLKKDVDDIMIRRSIVLEEEKNAHSLGDNIKSVSISKYIDRRKIGDILIGLIFIFLSLLFIVSFSLHSIIPHQSQYKDCYEIRQDNKPDGLYRLNLNNEQVYTYCRNGSTLIQKRSPITGNNRNYFDRGNNEYVDGFGFVEKEMFLGLKNILELNKNNNTILEIEATKDDGSKLFATFDQFILLEEGVDDITYQLEGFNMHIRTRNESYPILSLGNQSSVGVEGGQIFVESFIIL